GGEAAGRDAGLGLCRCSAQPAVSRDYRALWSGRSHVSRDYRALWSRRSRVSRDYRRTSRSPFTPTLSPEGERETCVSRSPVHVLAHPCLQVRAVAPHLRHPVPRLRRCDPRLGRPPLPVDEPLVPQQLGARVVLRIRRGDTLELLALYVVTLLAQAGDDAGERAAILLRGHRPP